MVDAHVGSADILCGPVAIGEMMGDKSFISKLVSGPNAREIDTAASALGRAAPHYKDVLVLGPAPAPLAMVRSQHRRRFLIRADKSVNMQRLVSDWIDGVDISCKVRVKADIDPYSFI